MGVRRTDLLENMFVILDNLVIVLRSLIIMKIEEGIVIEVVDNIAKVKVGRHSDCSSCGACAGSNNVIIDANNKIGAKIGQRVSFEVNETNVLSGAFIVFVMPIIVAFIGVICGRFIANYIGANTNVFQIAGGVIAFLLSLIFIKMFDKAATISEESKPAIIKIL